MSLADALIAAVAERARRPDLSSWQKAREMLEFQLYLRSKDQPHSTRDLARSTGVAQTKVSEQLTIASELTEDELAQHKIEVGEIESIPHSTLFRIAKLPHYLRGKPLRDAVRKGTAAAGAIGPYAPRGPREHRRAAAYARMREEGNFLVEVPKPIVELSSQEAKDYLDEFLPALANLAEAVIGSRRSYYIGLAGNGGIVIYLAPTR